MRDSQVGSTLIGLIALSACMLIACGKRTLLPDPNEFVAAWQISELDAPCDKSPPPSECHHATLGDVFNISRGDGVNFGASLVRLSGTDVGKIETAGSIQQHDSTLVAHFADAGHDHAEHWVIFSLLPRDDSTFRLRFELCLSQPVWNGEHVRCDDTRMRHVGSGHSDD